MKDGYTGYPVRASASLMPFGNFRPGAWLLTGVEVGYESRGKGEGRKLMNQVLADADAEGVPLYLSIEPDGTGLGVDELRAWYERLGFADDPTTDGMVREPRMKGATITNLADHRTFDHGTPFRCWKCGGKEPVKCYGEGGYVWACPTCPHPAD